MQIQTKWITYDKTKPFELGCPNFQWVDRRSSAFQMDAFWIAFYYGSAKGEGPRLTAGAYYSPAAKLQRTGTMSCSSVYFLSLAMSDKRCLLTKLHIKYVLCFYSLLLHSLLPHHPCPLELPKERDYTEPWVE